MLQMFLVLKSQSASVTGEVLRSSWLLDSQLGLSLSSTCFTSVIQLWGFAGVTVPTVKHQQPSHSYDTMNHWTQDDISISISWWLMRKIWHLFSRRDTEAKTPTVVRDDQWTEWLMEGPTRETSEALTLVEGPLVEVEPVKLVWRLWEAERSGYPSDGGGVSSTVHVLVHLLGHLLCMAKVGGGHCHSAKHEQRDQNHHSNMLEGDSWSENWTSSALSHIF